MSTDLVIVDASYSIFPQDYWFWDFKNKSCLTEVFAFLNLAILIFIIISGFIKGDLHNWNLRTGLHVEHICIPLTPPG